jgi:hypothetical protein
MDDLQIDLIKLAFGCGLTTLFGGLLASVLQTRLSRQEWQPQRTLQDSEGAKQVFEDVSRLMDKTLFRLSRLRLWVRRNDPMRLAQAIDDYREMVREWNDGINQNLSLLQFHFGTGISDVARPPRRDPQQEQVPPSLHSYPRFSGNAPRKS